MASQFLPPLCESQDLRVRQLTAVIYTIKGFRPCDTGLVYGFKKSEVMELTLDECRSLSEDLPAVKTVRHTVTGFRLLARKILPFLIARLKRRETELKSLDQ